MWLHSSEVKHLGEGRRAWSFVKGSVVDGTMDICVHSSVLMGTGVFMTLWLTTALHFLNGF